MPIWAWIPLFVLLFVAVVLAIVVVLGRVRGGRYLRPIVTFLSKVPLLKRWFQRMSIAALERQNPELASAMKKMQAFGEPKTAEQAQRMLNLLTPSERRAYMEAVGQEAEMPEATNRQLRRRMEHGGAGMPVRAAPAPQRPGSAGRKSGKNAKKKRRGFGEAVAMSPGERLATGTVAPNPPSPRGRARRRPLASARRASGRRRRSCGS